MGRREPGRTNGEEAKGRVLSRVQRADLAILAGWLDDPTRFAEHDTPTRVPREDLERRFGDTGYDDRELTWRLIRAEDGAPAGLVSAAPGRGPGSVEIGFLLAESEARGQGLARRAVRELLAELFGDAANHEAVAYVHPDNTSSNRLLADLGFRVVGTAPKHRLVHGHWVDFQIHTLTSADWRG